MRTVSGFVLATIIVLSACARQTGGRPQDLALTLDWDTGALPPPYHYSFSIQINPDGDGKFSYQPGYSPETDTQMWQTEFKLTQAQMDALFAYLGGNNLLRSNWAKGLPLLGGKGTSISITAGGKEYTLPSVSELAPKEREAVEALIEHIRSYVPQTIWDEMARRQADYEASAGN